MYRALVIGCGNIGALYDLDNDQIITHARAIRTNPQFSLSIFDTNKELAKKVSDRYQCELIGGIDFETLRMFNCVSICTPTHTHHDYLVHAIDAEVKVIVCEKPVANAQNELEDLYHKYSAGNSKIIVNYIRRFQPAYRELKSLITKLLEIESLTNISVRYQRGFINNCSHAFDTIEYLTDSKMVLEEVKTHNKAFDHFQDDPTLSLQAMWNKANVTITGLGHVGFSHFEVDLYFDYHKVCLKNSGQNIEVYKAPNTRQTLSAPVIQNEFTREDCLRDYMKPVFEYVSELISEREEEDNFLRSIDLVLRMKKYMNN